MRACVRACVKIPLTYIITYISGTYISPVQRRVTSTIYMQNNIIHCKYRCVDYTCPAAYRPKRVPVNKAGHSGACVVHDPASCCSPFWIQSVFTHPPSHPPTQPPTHSTTHPLFLGLSLPQGPAVFLWCVRIIAASFF